MKKTLKKFKRNVTNNKKQNRGKKVTALRAKSVLSDKEVFKQRITSVNENKRCEVFDGATLDQIIDIHSRYGSKYTSVYMISAEDYIKPLTEDYYRAICRDVIELPDKKTMVLIFEPYNRACQRCTDIGLTLSKIIRSSDALGEFIFGMDFGADEVHSYDSLVVNDMEAFRKLVLGREFGIEVSVNLDTGWLYVTDFFHLVDSEDKIPSCPEEIIRNEF